MHGYSLVRMTEHDEDAELAEKLAYWRETGGLNISPKATPNRTPQKPSKPHEPNNAWERGVATDHRGMPYLNSDLSPMGVKRFSELRSKFEDRQKSRINTSGPSSGS